MGGSTFPGFQVAETTSSFHLEFVLSSVLVFSSDGALKSTLEWLKSLNFASVDAAPSFNQLCYFPDLTFSSKNSFNSEHFLRSTFCHRLLL